MYLAKVVDALDDGYEEISDVTMRHKTLKDAHTVRTCLASFAALFLPVTHMRCNDNTHNSFSPPLYCPVNYSAQDLGEQSQKNNTSIEATRLKLVSLRQEQQNKILVMNGEVQDDQKLIESLRVKCSTVRVAACCCCCCLEAGRATTDSHSHAFAFSCGVMAACYRQREQREVCQGQDNAMRSGM